jgi:hypothetical protein
MALDFHGLEPTANDAAGLGGRVRIPFGPLCIAHSFVMAGTTDVVGDAHSLLSRVMAI